MNSGDGWTICSAGHQHWGLYGAAGLLVADGHRVILQHRAPWTHQGDSWGIPGGARDKHETAVQAALRESTEEAGIDPTEIIPIGVFLDDHGGWSYTTVVAVAATPTMLFPVAANDESVSIDWVNKAEVTHRVLHSGFALTWPQLIELPPSLHLLVAQQLLDDPLLQGISAEGIAAGRLPAGTDAGNLSRLIPAIHPVADSAATLELLERYAESAQVIVVSNRAELELLA